MPRLRSPFADWTRDWTLLAASVAGVGVFFGVQLTLFNNFIVERLDIEARELGWVESLREVPGFLNAFFVALMIRMAPSLVAAAALAIMGLGLMAYADVGSVPALILYSLVWSVGFHCWLPMEATLALRFSPAGGKGRWLGQLRAIGSIAMLVTIGACMLLLDLVNYEGMYLLAGGATVLGGAVLIFASRGHAEVEEKGFVLKRRYGLYYLLQFLEGCRRQIFTTFAVFALVKVHGMPVKTTITLLLINQVLVTLTAPAVGRLVDLLGERRMLTVGYALLSLVFVGYGLIDHRPTLYVLYCLDNLLFMSGIALTTYINKIALAEDLKPTLSMGVTMNHFAAVAVPLLFGTAWHFFGHRVIFLTAAVLALLSTIASQWVNPARFAGQDSGSQEVSGSSG